MVSPGVAPVPAPGRQGYRVRRAPSPRDRKALGIAGRVGAGLLGAAGVGILVALAFPGGREAVRQGGERVVAMFQTLRPASTDQEAYIRARLASRVRDAIDPTDPTTRDTAVQIAARQQGTFRVEQVAAIWSYVREHWRYVNDPHGREYFARASETIRNGYAGDCDDFAITLAAMVGAIGGEARVIFMEGPRGGHAYAEACIREDNPTTVATKLARFYGRNWARYASGPRRQIAFRRSDDCPVWLNLDWNARVPGGDYEPEQWAVAIYPDGHTEALAGAGPAGSAVAGARTAPRVLATPPE